MLQIRKVAQKLPSNFGTALPLGVAILAKTIQALWKSPVSGFQFSVPGSRFPVPGSPFPVPDCRFPVPDCRFPIPGSRFPVPGSRFPVPGSQFPYVSRSLSPVLVTSFKNLFSFWSRMSRRNTVRQEPCSQSPSRYSLSSFNSYFRS